MRVLVSVDSLITGGVEMHTVVTARALRRSGHEVTVASGGGDLSSLLVSSGIRHLEIPFTSLRTQDVVTATRRLARDMREHRVQVAHLNPFFNLLPAVLACQETGTPYVLAYHGVQSMNRDLIPTFGLAFSDWFRTEALPRAAAVIAVSDEVRAHLAAEFDVPLDWIQVVPNPVERIERPDPLPPHPDRPLSVLIASRVDEDKLDSVRAALELSEALHYTWPAGVSVTVAGGGHAMPALDALISQINDRLGTTAVTAVGPRADIAADMRHADLVVGMGRVVLEAVASGRLAVLAGYNGLGGVVTGRSWTGLVADNFSGRSQEPADAAACAQDVVATLLDPGRFRQTVADAWSAAADYDAGTIAARLYKLYTAAEAAEVPQRPRDEAGLSAQLYGDNPPRSLADADLPDALLQEVGERLGRRYQGDGLSYALGVAHGLRGRRQEAVEHLRTALAQRPGDPAIHFHLGHQLLALGRAAEGYAHLERVLEANPQHAIALLGLARAADKLGHAAEAQEFCRRALAIDPNYFDAHYYMAYFLERGEDLEAAAVHYERALALRPDDAATAFRMAVTLGRLGRTDVALQHLDKALAGIHVDGTPVSGWARELLWLTQSPSVPERQPEPVREEDSDTVNAAYQEVLKLSREMVERERLMGETVSKLTAREVELQHVRAALEEVRESLAQARERVATLEERLVDVGGRCEAAVDAREAAERELVTARQDLERNQAEVRRLVEAVEWQGQALQRIQGSRAWKLALALAAPYATVKSTVKKAGHQGFRTAISVGKRVLPNRVKIAVYPTYLNWRKRILPEARPYALPVMQGGASAVLSAPAPTATAPAAAGRTGETNMWPALAPFWLGRRRPKVSVIIPVYNHADMLSASLDSMLNQTYDNLEIIVLNDGSKDAIEPVMARYADNPRVKLFTQQNQGLPRALTNAFRQATGEYYLWTSADNIALPRQVEALLTYLILHPETDMVYSNYSVIDDAGNQLEGSEYRVHNQLSPGSQVMQLPHMVNTLGLVADNFIGASFMYTARAGRILGEYDPTMVGTEDYDYWLRMEQLFRIHKLDSEESLYEYRVHANSLSEKFGNSHIRSNVPKLLEYNRERQACYDRPFDVVFLAADSPATAGSRALMVQWAHVYHRAGCNVVWAGAGTSGLPEDVHVVEGTADAIRSACPRAKRMVICDHTGPDYGAILAILRADTADIFVTALVPQVEGAIPGDSYDYFLPMTGEAARAVAPVGVDRFLRVGRGLPDRDLLMKARDNRYWLWDFPATGRVKVGYFGPVRRELFDLDYLRALIAAMPHVDFVFIGTEGESDYDLHELRGPDNFHFLGIKPKAELYRYLSGYGCMILPFNNSAEALSEAERLAMEWVLLAGRPVVAAAMPGEVRLPYLAVTAAPHQAAQDIAGLAAQPVDLALVDRYLSAHTWERQAGRLRALANNRLFYARTRGVEKRERSLIETPPARFGPGKQRVLVEVNSLDKGGLEQVIYNLVLTMDRERFEIIIACIERDGYVADLCRTAGVPVHVLGEEKERDYADLLTRYQIDLVNQHYSTFGGEIAARLGIPVVAVLHNSYVWMEDEQIRHLQLADRWISQYIAVSSAVKSYAVRRIGLDPDKVTVVPNGAPIHELRAKEARAPRLSRKEFGLSDSDYVLLNLASVDGRKGQNAIINAMRAVVKKRPDVKVLIAGNTLDPHYYEECQRRIKRYRLEGSIIYTGFITETHDLFRMSDAFLLPSIVEGWSVAMTEAMYFGLPLLLTDVGGARDVIEQNDIGLLLPTAFGTSTLLTPRNLYQYTLEEEPANTPALTEAMLEFASNREQWRRAGAGGRDKVLTLYPMEKVARRYEELMHAAARYEGAQAASL